MRTEKNCLNTKLVPVIISLVKWKQSHPSASLNVSQCVIPDYLHLPTKCCVKAEKKKKKYTILAPSSSSCSFHQSDPPPPPSSFPSLQDLAAVLASVLFRTNKTYQNRVSKTDVLIGDGKQMRHAHSLPKSFNLQQKFNTRQEESALKNYW